MSEHIVHLWALRGPEATTRTREALPSILRCHVGHDPDVIRDRWGKPRLASGEARFSVTHAEGIGLIAITSCVDVGVDAERLSPRRVDLGVARRFLGYEVAHRVARLPEPSRTLAFLAAWTRLEAM